MYTAITLVEPTARVRHAGFNSSLVALLADQFPGAKLTFRGTEAQARDVRDTLRAHGLPVAAAFDPIDPDWDPRPDEPPAGQAARLRAAVTRHRAPGHLLVLCSTPPGGLYALSRLPPRAASAEVVAFEHHVTQINNPWARRPWLWKYHPRSVLRRPAPGGVRFVVLGESILRNVRTALGFAPPGLSAIDLPRLPPPAAPGGGAAARGPGAPIRVGFLGTAGVFRQKGFHLFVEAAWALRHLRPAVSFELVGGVPPGLDRGGLDPVEVPAEGFLDPPAYETRLAGLDYAVMVGDPAHYALNANATFADAMAHRVPVVGLANDYIDYYFDRRGPAGLLTRDPADLPGCLQRAVEAVGTDAYAAYRTNAGRVAADFAIGAVGRSLKALLGGPHPA